MIFTVTTPNMLKLCKRHIYGRDDLVVSVCFTFSSVLWNSAGFCAVLPFLLFYFIYFLSLVLRLVQLLSLYSHTKVFLWLEISHKGDTRHINMTGLYVAEAMSLCYFT